VAELFDTVDFFGVLVMQSGDVWTKGRLEVFSIGINIETFVYVGRD